MDLLTCLVIACALPAVLGLLEVVLAHIQRKRAYRSLPAPDCPRDRAQRALTAYRNNARAYSGLRDRA